MDCSANEPATSVSDQPAFSRTMAQRTGEFGIRIALGARAADITRLVLTSGAKLAVLGSAIGLRRFLEV